jgi:hypothetical protein
MAAVNAEARQEWHILTFQRISRYSRERGNPERIVDMSSAGSGNEPVRVVKLMQVS